MEMGAIPVWEVGITPTVVPQRMPSVVCMGQTVRELVGVVVIKTTLGAAVGGGGGVGHVLTRGLLTRVSPGRARPITPELQRGDGDKKHDGIFSGSTIQHL